MRQATVFLLMTFSIVTFAGDQGFRLVTPEAQQCKNAQHQIGRNPDFMGECGSIIRLNLSEQDFTSANLKGAYFIETQANKIKLSKADLTGGIIRSGRFVEADFTQAKLNYLRLEAVGELTVFSQANFEGADLSNLEMNGSPGGFFDFQRASFKNAILNDVFVMGNFSFGDLTQAKGLRARMFGKYVNTNFSNADFRQAQMGDSEMRSAKFYEANFSSASLPRADFSGAFFIGSNFSRANLEGAKLNGARLYGADFSQANLNKAILSAAHIRGADLRNTQLCGADLRQIDIQFGILLNGAQYNAQTQLPFNDDAAERLGMRKVQTCL